MWTFVFLLLTMSILATRSDEDTANLHNKVMTALKPPIRALIRNSKIDARDRYYRKKKLKYFEIHVNSATKAENNSRKAIKTSGNAERYSYMHENHTENIPRDSVKQIKIMHKIDQDEKNRKYLKKNFQKADSWKEYINALNIDYYTSESSLTPVLNTPKSSAKYGPFDSYKYFTTGIVPSDKETPPFIRNMNDKYDIDIDEAVSKVTSAAERTTETHATQKINEVGVNETDKANIQLDIGDVKIAIDAPKTILKGQVAMLAQKMYSHLMEFRNMHGADGGSNRTQHGSNKEIPIEGNNTFGDTDSNIIHPFAANIDHGQEEPSHMNMDYNLALRLYQNVRVLCMVMTKSKRHKTMAVHVKSTWGSKCNKLIFMSSSRDRNLPTVNLRVNEGEQFLWTKTKEAFSYVYEHHRHDADWFLKAEDNTYVILENLRWMLANHDSNKPIYFGCRLKPFTKRQGYMSGEAGYVLSGAALDRLYRSFQINLCHSFESSAEDVELGKCMEHIGVRAMDSRDSQQRERFYPFPPRDLLFPQEKNAWYYNYMYYPPTAMEGLQCCSNSPISFHGFPATEMYTLEYLIYHLRPHGQLILDNEENSTTQAKAKISGSSAEIHYNSLN